MRRVAALVLAAAFLGPAAAFGEEETAPEGREASRMETVEEQIRILAEEIADLRQSEAVPYEIDPTEGVYGLGPSASKVYKRGPGLSIGGYGELRLREHVTRTGENDSIYDAVRLVLYTGYKFNDWIVFNSEVEFEHADTGSEGSVAVEFMTLDFLFTDWLNLRTGLVLIPMGFINEVHEPPFYFGAERPEVERRIIPTTWRENGMGVFGSFGELSFRMYAVNSFEASGFRSDGLRGGRQKGSKALSENWAFVGRLDYDLVALLPGAELGASVWSGKTGQNQDVNRCVQFCGPFAPGTPPLTPLNGTFSVPDAVTHIYEVHAQYKGYGLSLRGLFAEAFVDDAAELSTAIGLAASDGVASKMIGGYAEIGYDVLPLVFPDTGMSFEPFFRYEYLDTQFDTARGFGKNKSREFDLYIVGASYKPIPQVVVKLDYRNFDARGGRIADEVQFSVGFVF